MNVTEKKLAANRANAQKSTGPRTQAGKNRSRLNGVSHRIFCNDLVLPGEKVSGFHSFRNAILLKLSPQDVVELMLVDRIVAASWRLRRMNTVENLIAMTESQGMVDDQHERACEEMEELEDACKSRVAHRSRLDKNGAAEAATPEVGLPEKGDPEKIAGAAALAELFLENHPAMDRVSQHQQRLELSIYRALHQLQKMRSARMKRTQNDESDVAAYCPFVPVDAYELEGAEPPKPIVK